MRIAYLVSQYPAPSHTFIRREVEELRRRGYEVETFSVRTPSEAECSDASDREAYGTTRYLLPLGLRRLVGAHLQAAAQRPGKYTRTLAAAVSHRVPGVRSLVWGLFHFAEAIVLAQDLERAEVEHLHNHFANSGANVGYLASRFLDLDWSLTLHGTADFGYPSGLMLERKLEHARFAVCVSHFGRAQAFLVTKPKVWSKLFVSRCGLDPASYPGRPPEAGPRRLRVVTVGRLSPEKGQLGLLEAFAGVVRRGFDVELRIVGDGPMRQALEARIAELGLGDRCLLLGRLSEAAVTPELAAADVFALTSFMEGLPVVLMEALAMELGVVAPQVAGIPELVEHERTGLLFAPGNWQQLEERLGRLLTDAPLRQRLGAEGRKRVLAEFDIARAVEPLIEHLGGRSA